MRASEGAVWGVQKLRTRKGTRSSFTVVSDGRDKPAHERQPFGLLARLAQATELSDLAERDSVVKLRTAMLPDFEGEVTLQGSCQWMLEKRHPELALVFSGCIIIGWKNALGVAPTNARKSAMKCA